MPSIAARSKWTPERKQWALMSTRLWIHKLTLDEYHALFEKQNEQCAICKETLPTINPANTSNVAIDHNHETNKVRGLLCGFCNRGLGNFRDNRTNRLAA